MESVWNGYVYTYPPITRSTHFIAQKNHIGHKGHWVKMNSTSALESNISNASKPFYLKL